MNVSDIAKSTQEQAAAAWINHLNQLRLDALVEKLNAQDINLEKTLLELGKLKAFVGDPSHILGSMDTKHGEVAEHAQVNISNARNLIRGLKSEYTFEGVARTAPEDYLHNGVQVQSKFVLTGGRFSLNSVEEHLTKYPDFLKNGGKYQIPKDFYGKIEKLLALSQEEAARLPSKGNDGINYSQWQWIQNFFKTNDISIEQIEPSIMDYSEIQLGKIGSTITTEEESLLETDKSRRNAAYGQSKPSLEEGIKAAKASALLEGGMSFCLGVHKKRKSGKKLSDFTAKDWKDIGIDTAAGTGKGAIRGASVYGLSNFTATPAAVASALVTASFGIAAQARLLQQGNISEEDFLVNSEVLCLDVSVSAVSSLLGQVLIPVPVLGALVGNATGMFMYGIAKDNLSYQEQALIAGYNSSMQELNQRLDAQYRALLDQLLQEFARFKSVLELAFDLDVNVAFAGSIGLAQHLGCDEEKILWDKQAVDAYFLS